MLEVVVRRIQGVAIRAVERGPESGIQALDEPWEGVFIGGKHDEERGMVTRFLCLEESIPQQKVVIRGGGIVGSRNGMPNAAEETGGG